MKSGLVITGVIIFLLALIFSIIMISVGAFLIESPSEDYDKYTEGSGNIYLEKGTFTIWSDERDIDLRITSPSGDEVDIVKNMDIQMVDVSFVGIIEVEEEGTHYFDTNGADCTIYVQNGEPDPGQFMPFCSGCCCGLIFVPLGLLLVLIGLLSKKR